MLLSPKKVKFQKQHSRKENLKTMSRLRYTTLGNVSLYSEACGKINAKQIQTVKFFLRKASQRQAKFWTYMPIFRSITKKPNEVRLGRGKGGVKYWCFVVRPGSLILEVCARNPSALKRILFELRGKFSAKTIVCNKFSRWVL